MLAEANVKRNNSKCEHYVLTQNVVIRLSYTGTAKLLSTPLGRQTDNSRFLTTLLGLWDRILGEIVAYVRI